MKRLAIVSLILAAGGASASAGVVSFDPPVREVDPAIDTTTTFDVGIGASDLAYFTSLNMIIGSDDLLMWDWVYAPGSCPLMHCDWTYDSRFYRSEIEVGWFGLFPTQAWDFVVGTVTVDAADLTGGTYTVMVDAIRDGGRSGICFSGQCEPLSGAGVVHVVPEPATAVLLGLAALAVGHPRRSKR